MSMSLLKNHPFRNIRARALDGATVVFTGAGASVVSTGAGAGIVG